MSRESYGDEQIRALTRGDIEGCFGPEFAGLELENPPGLPSGRMTLVHRIIDLDPEGGRCGLGRITGEADIRDDDWFLTCHFCDDHVMPGTLMYECCLHTLRVYLLRLGWLGETASFVYEPIPGEVSSLRCRGQVLETTKKVQYEITVRELGYRGPEETPSVLADALMYVDGKPAIQMTNMSLRLQGLSRAGISDLWAKRRRRFDGSLPRPAIFDEEKIRQFTEGRPSLAFGNRYEVFDEERVIARLPRAPYRFLDRIVEIRCCEQWKLEAGGEIVSEYDVPPEAWYFLKNGQDRSPVMPFAVLLEVALQPCGWLAAYLGSALTSDIDLSFRNLGGSAVQRRQVRPDEGTLSVEVKITGVSQSAGMIIQNFDFLVRSRRGVIYSGDTVFGFFSKSALADQVGIRDAQPYVPSGVEIERADSFPYPEGNPFPDEMLRMIDRVDRFDPQGGPSGLGFIEGSLDVRPAWFYEAHFFQDPVTPGSLGLESFLQLLKVYSMNRWNRGRRPGSRFEAMVPAEKHSWTYRGQIIQTDRLVKVQACVTGVDDDRRIVRADGWLSVDGRAIYKMVDFSLIIRV
jgi:3-hydroxymyristoyl/3-hydroxydecanoyl-(acyl carrier protein) dehydratase